MTWWFQLFLLQLCTGTALKGTETLGTVSCLRTPFLSINDATNKMQGNLEVVLKVMYICDSASFAESIILPLLARFCLLSQNYVSLAYILCECVWVYHVFICL